VLHVHRAERADGLVEALRALLADPLPDPFAPEVVAVPTRGMERWLAQRVSDRLGAGDGRGDGVCANVGFPSPRRLVGDAVATASGIEADVDPWRPERAVWALLEVVDECQGEPWLASLAAHLGGVGEDVDPARRARRFSAVRHLAELFDRYALHRPEMVRGWARGDDGALPADGAWQAELWRRLRRRMGVPDQAERVEAACARLREEPGIVELPARLSLFGLTRLPAGHLDVLRALAHGRDVHVFMLHPSPALWERIAPLDLRVVRRREEPTVALPANRLLASWGQDAREMQLVLGASEHVDHHHEVEHRTGTLLARLQSDVRADRWPAVPSEDDARPALDEHDRSVQIHACHGRARQVEVLRDAILHLLDEDPTLEPRDVIVMCPDIETFAPLIQATFGAGEVFEDDDELDALPEDVRPPDLRVRLADRSIRQTNPVLGVVARLLDLVDERLTASQVLDLADQEPVRRRFELDDDDLARIEDWVAASGIRWGLDAQHRAPFKLDALAAGTWRAGVDRLLVGVTMTEDEQRLFHDVLPLDDVDSGAIDVAGRFAELVDRLQISLDALSEPKTIDAWAAAIAGAADALTATGERDAWQRAELDRLLGDVADEAAGGTSAGATRLVPAEVRALLADRLKGRPTRANFRTGHLTICTLMPMRSVPHRVVCLLGMDDGVFPRKSPRDGDNLMLADPRVGDRDARTEDRQLLLDALLAATDQLIVTYTGNDERTNLVRPPAVPIGELLDVVDRTVRTDEGRPRDRVEIRHPLQPFDPKNFTVGELVPERAWSFDPVTLHGAQALTADRAPASPFLAGPLPPQDKALVELEDLVRFAAHPVRAFLRQRLGISVGDYADEVADTLPVELDALERWGVGQRLLDGVLAGAEIEACVAAEIARGTLPPGRLAIPVIDRIRPVVAHIAAAANAELEAGAEPASVDVKVALADGRSLSGTVAGVYGDVLRSVTYSRVNARHRLAAYVRWLALTAAHPDRPFAAAAVGQAQRGAPDSATITIARIPPLADDAATRARLAREQLETLVDLYDRGMREPLPLACMTSAAYAIAARAGADAGKAARSAWESAWNFPKEDADLEHQLVRGEIASFDELTAEPPRLDECGAGWDETETTRFGRYAVRLWDGLLSTEAVFER
jgi:exodeoxyribonuclease V gamma subunit